MTLFHKLVEAIIPKKGLTEGKERIYIPIEKGDFYHFCSNNKNDSDQMLRIEIFTYGKSHTNVFTSYLMDKKFCEEMKEKYKISLQEKQRELEQQIKDFK